MWRCQIGSKKKEGKHIRGENGIGWIRIKCVASADRRVGSLELQLVHLASPMINVLNLPARISNIMPN